MKQTTEFALEAAIEDRLVTAGGYKKGDRNEFDTELCLFTNDFIEFVKRTQAEQWEYLVRMYKEEAQKRLIDDLCKALNSDNRGCLYVLRHGFKCSGKLFRAAYFAPASKMNPEIQKLYAANELTIIRQLRYCSKYNKTLDIVLALNGIPVSTIELKNPMSGQTWRDAVAQYKNDRDPYDLIFQFKKRSFVHFAVDTDEVYMTTRLEGKKTRFIPFNIGCDMGKGNPDNPDGYKTAYLWENVLQLDSFIDIIAKFIHLEVKEKKETMIFPRYHQLDCVRKLSDHAQKHGTGKNYLIQHSAGSGKSNSIAWLAYRLANLFNDKDEKVFDSVIVVTDRVVLDSQLQETIYQFEHKQGVVQKIDKDSAQLAKALVSGELVIITTLQKFPFVTEKIDDLPARRYAVVIDEAHSSQSGEAAAELKGVLSGDIIKKEARAKADEQGLADYEEEIIKTMAKRGHQPNISFFAFTATPKYKTLEIFGSLGADGKPEPFHLYSMRQAIEEGFILNVLQNYLVYKTYVKLSKSVKDDPKVDKKKASVALARFINLHPHNIQEKTKLIIEHFRRFTMHKIFGRAKAMVVTSGRIQAVRYKEEFDRYIKEKNYKDIKTLVAFSGAVNDPDIKGVEYTEFGMNIDSRGKNIKEKEIPTLFDTDEYKFLIVAEKFQTGFDQPLLHTMYIDKKLSGIKAVQTLSRLNRIYPGKEDTFILDFVNEPKEIQDSFQPYYEQTLTGERAEPSQLYELYATLEDAQVYYKKEIEDFCKIFCKPKSDYANTDHASMNACIDPAVRRYNALETEIKEYFRKTLTAYKNLYSFMSQIIDYRDSDLEKLYCYIRFFLNKLPKGDFGHCYDFSEDVDLQYYRIQKESESGIALKEKSAEEYTIAGPVCVGTGKTDDNKVDLSKLIQLLNKRFGTDFKTKDQLCIDSVYEKAVSHPEIQKAAKANDEIDNFYITFREVLYTIFLDRIEQDEDITYKFINENKFRNFVGDFLKKKVYKRLRATASL